MNNLSFAPSRSQTMSPASTAGSEWSGINGYESGNKGGAPYSPTLPFNRGELVTPPTPSSSNGVVMPIPSKGGPPPFGAPPRRPSEPALAQPSPPSSFSNSNNSRASDGTLSDQQSRKYRRMEDTLGQHYTVLRRFLNGTQAQPPRPNKARDKLLRLSPVQFHELSTDVYDELLRRQASAPPPPPGPGRPARPPPQNVPPYLMPRKEFHEKRNQARQKLSSLQQQRFRDLATDVFCELERRFPHFQAISMDRRGSPAPSQRGPPSRGPPSNGMPPPGFPGAPRSQSRGPPAGRGGPPGSGGFPPQGRGFSPRNGSVAGSSPGGGSPDNEFDRPLPKQFQSSTIVPNKSTMVEDDDDLSPLEDAYDRRSDAFGLDGTGNSVQSKRDTSGTSRSTASSARDKLLADSQAQVADLQEQIETLELDLTSKDEEIIRLQEDKSSGGDNQEWSEVKQDLEKKVEEAESLNHSLKDQLDRIHMEQANVERDLRSQLDQVKKNSAASSQWQSKYEKLDRDHANLNMELEDQQKVTEEVRQQASLFLNEMRAMAENGGGNFEREEKLTRDVGRLEEEVKDWKSRYARTKTQLRNARAASIGLSIARPDASRTAKDKDFTQPDGLVKDVHVTKFQISIDELLHVARAEELSAVLQQMKAVVIAIRNITQDIDAAPLNKEDEGAQRRLRLKTKVSATANNLITASKNYASSNGLSPVSLLDAAASHLTAAVVELVKTVKIYPTPAGELEDDDDGNLDEPLQSPGYFDITHHTRQASANESVYSAVSPPPSEATKSIRKSIVHRRSASRSTLQNGKGPATGVQLGFGMRQQDSDLEELKLYLEDQTDMLVRSIQYLVGSIRGEDEMPIVRKHINSIANVVGRVVSATEGMMKEPTAVPALRERADPIVQSLAECQMKLINASADSEEIQDRERLREFTNKLPPLAFEIARETKELVQRIEQIDFLEDEDEDFR